MDGQIMTMVHIRAEFLSHMESFATGFESLSLLVKFT